MKRALVRAVCLAVIVAAALPAATGAVAADDVTVTVSVIDREGNPIGGVGLSITWNETGGPKTVETFSNGKAFVDVPDGANVEVAVDDDTYIRNSPRVFFNVEAEQTLEVPVSLPGNATVTITDEDGPVEDANVRLTGRQAERNAETGADGRAQFGPVERGNYNLRVTKPGYLTENQAIDIDQQTNASIEIAEADRTLRVLVVDNHFEPAEPVADATVDIEGVGTLTTGSEGQRATTVAVNRDYDLTVSKDGYETVSETVAVGESDRQVTVSIRRTPEITVEAANDRVVVGESTRLTVTDEYGEPVEGAAVSLGEEEVGQTDADGEFDLTVESAGDQRVTVTTNGLADSITIEGVESAGEQTATETETRTATATKTETATETAGGIGPGFGVVAALIALGCLLLLRRR